MNSFNLTSQQLTVAEVHRNLPPRIYEAGASAEIKAAGPA
jgi:hypothetical protein